MSAVAAPAGRRLSWLDLARGLAVVSMIVAHTSPWGGILNGSEYLTAPWFATIVGISLLLAWQKAAGHPGQFIAGNIARGLILIAVGEVLQRLYSQIVIVLQTLGLLTIVVAPLVVLVGRRPRVWAATAVVFAGVSPLLMASGRVWLAHSGQASPALIWIMGLAATGEYYRVTAFMAMAAAGIAVTPVLLGGRAGGRGGALIALALFGAAGATYLIGKRSPWGAAAYSGSTPEIIGAILLSLSATWACAWIVASIGERRVRPWCGAVIDTGRMALSAYTLQVLTLAAIVRWIIPGQRDDHWAVMIGLIVLCPAFCWAWLRVLPIGPLEWVLRLPSSVLRRRPRAVMGR